MVKNIYERQTLGLNIPRVQMSTAPEELAAKVEQSAIRTAQELNTNADNIYKTDFEIASRKSISDIYAKNPNNPEKLRQDFDAAQKGLLKDASPQMAMELEARFEILTASHLARSSENKLKIDNDSLKEKALEGMNLAQNSMEHMATNMFSDNPEVAASASKSAQLALLDFQKYNNQTTPDGTPLFSPEQKVNRAQNFRNQSMFLSAQNYIQESDDPIAAYERIESGQKKLTFLDPEDNVQLELDPTSDMSVEDLWKLRQKAESLFKAKAKEIEVVQSLEYGREMYDGDRRVDPKNKDDRNDLNLFFDTVLAPEIKNMPDAQKTEAIVEFTNRTGIVPDLVTSNLRKTIRSGAVESIEASRQLTSIINNNPMTASEFDSEDRLYAIAINDRYMDGLDPKEVIKQVQEEFNPLSKDKRDFRKENFKRISKDTGISAENIVSSSFTEFNPVLFGKKVQLPADARVSDDILRNINRELEQNYVKYPDPQVAVNATQQYARSRFGITYISGNPRWSTLPIENQYKIPGVNDSGWIKNQLVTDINKLDPKIIPDSLIIEADPQTVTESNNKQNPSYPVMYTDEYGGVSPVLDNQNRPVRFIPNMQKQIDIMNTAAQEASKVRVRDKEAVSKFFKEQSGSNQVYGEFGMRLAEDLSKPKKIMSVEEANAKREEMLKEKRSSSNVSKYKLVGKKLQ